MPSRSIRIASVIVTLLATWLVATSAAAQLEGFALSRHQPAPSLDDGFSLVLPSTLGHLGWSAHITTVYANRPLALREEMGGEQRTVGLVVHHLVVSHGTFALGLGDRFELHVDAPLTLLASGDSPTARGVEIESPPSPRLGDISLGGSALIIGLDGSPLQLGARVALVLPTGSTEGLAGDGGVGARASLSFAYRVGIVTPVLAAGVALRPGNDYLGFETGPEVNVGAGAEVRITRSLRGLAELTYAGTVGSAQGFVGSTAMEGVLGAMLSTETGLVFGLAGGLGLTRAPGIPRVSLLFVVGFSSSAAGTGAAGDGEEEGDRDGDGVADGVDHCPDDAEDRDGDVDYDGCPEGNEGGGDADNDGVADSDDRCPQEPETRNGLNDEDGCPEAIDVGDGLIRLAAPIRFARRLTTLDDAAREGLALVAELLQARADIVLVQIEGHATRDDGPSERRRLLVSEGRAEAVRSALARLGVDSERLTSVGAGSSQPAAGGGSASRRVEFRIVEMR